MLDEPQTHNKLKKKKRWPLEVMLWAHEKRKMSYLMSSGEHLLYAEVQ